MSQYEEQVLKAIESLKQDEVVRQYFTTHGIPLSLIEKYPLRLERWRKNYEPCVHCSGLHQCGQARKGFFEGLQLDYQFSLILEACDYQKTAKQELQHMAYYTYCELAPQFEKASFQSIQMDQESKSYLMAVSQAMRASYENKGLYIEGNLGTGKTYLSACACNSHAQKKEYVSFVHMPSFIQKMMSLMNNGEYAAYLERVKKADFLVLDDIGAEAINAWSRDTILLPILMYRYDHGLCTWFTSNSDLKGLEKKYAHTSAGLDQTAAMRIVERIQSLSNSLVLTGADRRIKSQNVLK